MSQLDKLITRLLRVPADFSWDELVRVLSAFGYEEQTSSGSSHRKFYNRDTKKTISGLVKPHHKKHVGRAYLLMLIKYLDLKEEQ